MARKKYATEEERKAAKRAYMKEYNAKWYQEHKQEVAEKGAIYRQEHKNEIAEKDARYYQQHKLEIAEQHAKYYKEYKNVILEKRAKHYQEYRDERLEYMAKYHNTKEGRASNLISTYKQADKKYGRGDCDLTIPWFIENIFTKCIYCGETDWKKLGVDRIDNNLPHTVVNVVPCCAECNMKRQKKPFEQFYWESKHQNFAENICLTK